MCRNLIFHVIKQGVVLRTPLHLEARDVTPSPLNILFPPVAEYLHHKFKRCLVIIT